MRSDHEELLNWSIHHLVRSGIDHPESDAQIIYDEIIKKNEGGLYIKQAISRNVIERFKHCIKRRASREPINYILGRENFWSMEFQVTPDVLIPRRETELLIKEFLKLRADDSKSLKILDMCTGSGIIAVVVAKECPQSNIVAVDISECALEVAKINAKAHGVMEQIHFVQSDLFEKIRLKNLGPFDFILSNPPYINPELFRYLAPEMTGYEPDMAINGGKDGADFYQSIIPAGIEFLKPGGYLLLEFGFGLCEVITRIIQESQEFEYLQTVRDFNEILRVVSARKKGMVDG